MRRLVRFNEKNKEIKWGRVFIPYWSKRLSSPLFYGNIMKTKKCNKCKKEKSLSAFSKKKNTKDGRFHKCIICCKEMETEYFDFHEEIKRSKKKYQKKKQRIKKEIGFATNKHRSIVEKMLGRKLKRNEIIHHINGKPKDNRKCNLQLMTQSDHVKLHHKIKREKKEKELKRRAEWWANRGLKRVGELNEI